MSKKTFRMLWNALAIVLLFSLFLINPAHQAQAAAPCALEEIQNYLDPQAGGHILNALRLFRDKVMAQTEAGEQLIEQYYLYSPALIQAVTQKPYLAIEIWNVLTWVAPSLGRYVYGKYDGQDILTVGRYAQLKMLLDDLDAVLDDPTPEPSLPRELAALIRYYRQKLPLEQLIGKPLDSVAGLAVQQFIFAAPYGK